MSEQLSMKFCRLHNGGIGKMLPTSEFHTRIRKGIQGFQLYCKPCSSLLKSEWRRNNKRKINKQQKSWRAAHPEHVKSWLKKWRAKNHDKLVAQSRERILNRKGISMDWYNTKLLEQKGLCAICYSAPDSRKLAVDHNHTCCKPNKEGKTCGKCNRGLLCVSCNRALERIENIPDWYKSASNYLSRYVLNTS